MTTLLRHEELPERFTDIAALEEFMSRPTADTVAELTELDGDITVLGVGGKMGVTLARLLKRACPQKRVIGVSRFSDDEARQRLETSGVETVVCDLLDRKAVAELEPTANVVYLAGLKFDYRGREDFLWAMNTLAPAHVADHYRSARIVALSTIHVYPWSDPRQGGVTEACPPWARSGEYANSVVGRERIFQYHSQLHGTPGRIVRFVYAIDPRYGVLAEIADWVLQGKPIPLETGTVNLMWQGDAINQFARLLTRCEVPASPINIGAPGQVSVRWLAEQFGVLFDRRPQLTGAEDTCLAVNCEAAADLLGHPVVPLHAMIRWVGEWVQSGKPTLGKPSKFEVRDGIF